MSAGLSACFSQLPKCVFSEFALDSNEAHKLSVFDVKGMVCFVFYFLLSENLQILSAYYLQTKLADIF